MLFHVFTALAWALPTAPIRATTPDEVRLWVQGGWDPTVQLSVGVGGPIRAEGLELRWESVLDLPVFLTVRGVPSLGSGLGPSVRWDGARGFVSGAAYGTAHTAVDVTGSRLAFGTTLVGRAGILGGGGARALALEAQWSAAWATFTTPSDGVRDLYGDRPGAAVEGPRSGFYASTAHRLRVGITGAVAASDTVAVHGGLGLVHTPHAANLWFDVPVAPMPFYAHLGLSVQP